MKVMEYRIRSQGGGGVCDDREGSWGPNPGRSDNQFLIEEANLAKETKKERMMR